MRRSKSWYRWLKSETAQVAGHLSDSSPDDLILMAVHNGTVHAVTFVGANFTALLQPDTYEDLANYVADQELLAIELNGGTAK